MSVQFDEFLQEASGDSLKLNRSIKTWWSFSRTSFTQLGTVILLGTFNRRAYPEIKNTVRISWKKGPWNAYLSQTRISSFQEMGVTDNAKSVDVSQVHQMIYMHVLVRVNMTQAMQHVETHGR